MLNDTPYNTICSTMHNFEFGDRCNATTYACTQILCSCGQTELADMYRIYVSF